MNLFGMRTPKTGLLSIALASALFCNAPLALAYPPPPPPGFSQAQSDFANFHNGKSQNDVTVTTTTKTNPDGSTTVTVVIDYGDGTCKVTETTTYPDGSKDVKVSECTGFGEVDSLDTHYNSQGQVTQKTYSVHGKIVQTETFTYWQDSGGHWVLQSSTTTTYGPFGPIVENDTWSDPNNGNSCTTTISDPLMHLAQLLNMDQAILKDLFLKFHKPGHHGGMTDSPAGTSTGQEVSDIPLDAPFDPAAANNAAKNGQPGGQAGGPNIQNPALTNTLGNDRGALPAGALNFGQPVLPGGGTGGAPFIPAGVGTTIPAGGSPLTPPAGSTPTNPLVPGIRTGGPLAPTGVPILK